MGEFFLQHQTQPCGHSCVSAALAMLVGKPVNEIVERFHDEYRAGRLSMRSMLDSLGVPFQSFDSADLPDLSNSGAYLITTPSLNILGGVHQCVLEIGPSDYQVLDPVAGREGKRRYVKRGEAGDDPTAVELGGFTVDAFIPREWLEQNLGR